MALWHEGTRFSALKATLLALLFLPALWIGWKYFNDMLGPRALNLATHQIGQWTIRILFLTLAVSPLRRLWRWQRLQVVRRMLGVATFAYVMLHLLLYTADQGFKLGFVANEIVQRIYLTIGFAGILLLTPLAFTSTDRMVRRLGAKRWRQLHLLIFSIALIAIVHHFMQAKLEVDEPMLMAGLFAWLIGWRLLFRRQGPGSEPALSAVLTLDVATAAATVLFEALYIHLKVGAPVALVLQANLDFYWPLRPGWNVLAITLAVTAIGAVRTLQARRTRLRPA